MLRKNRIRLSAVILICAFLIFPSIVYVNTLEYGETIKTATLPTYSASGAYDPDNGLFYIVSEYTGQVYAYNLSTFDMVANISTGEIGSFVQAPGAVYDPVNKYLYVSDLDRLEVINTQNNTVAGTIYLGDRNITNSIVVDYSTGDVLVAAGPGIMVVNGTKLTETYNLLNILNVYNDNTYLAFNPSTNTSYLLFPMEYQELRVANKLSANNTTYIPPFRDFKQYPSFIKYIAQTNQLFVGTDSELYSISPSNISETTYIAGLKNSPGVKDVFYSAPTGDVYVATYGDSVQVFNDSTGAYLGTLRLAPPYNAPTSITQLSDGNLVITDGKWLYLVKDQLNNLQPDPYALAAASGISGAVVGLAALAVFYKFRSGKKLGSPGFFGDKD